MNEDERPFYYSGPLPDDPVERERILKIARNDADMQHHLYGLKRTAPLMFYILIASPFLALLFGVALFFNP